MSMKQKVKQEDQMELSFFFSLLLLFSRFRVTQQTKKEKKTKS